MSNILIVDDDPQVATAFVELLGTQGYEVAVAAGAQEALARMKAHRPDLVVMDVMMPGISGLEALRQMTASFPGLPVILITGQGEVETAIEATKLGAFDYQLKPFDPAQMLRLVSAALESSRLKQVRIELGPSSPPVSTSAVVGRSAAMQNVYKAIGRVAQTDATVLIRGESGTGKELVAQAVCQHSRRADKAFVAVNCVAIPEPLLESEVFGYERGAFTGAAARRLGKFEQASGGTLFLDEIGDLPLTVQAKLLRVLQDRCFQRLGGNETIHADVRIVAATNRDLERAVAQGQFREDLFHRLNVVTIRLPPLRDRAEDVPILAEFFLERAARELEIEPPAVSSEALEVLNRYSWPGNVRELEHCIRRTVIFTRGHSIQKSDLLSSLEGASDGPRGSVSLHAKMAELVDQFLASSRGAIGHQELLEQLDELLVTEALKRSAGNQTKAAQLLALPRPTLHAKMQKYGLRPSHDPNRAAPL